MPYEYSLFGILNLVVIYLTNVRFNKARWCFVALSSCFIISNICSSNTFSFNKKSTYSFPSMVSFQEFWTNHRAEWRLWSTCWYSCSVAFHNLAIRGSHCIVVARNPSSCTCLIDNKLALKATTSPSFTPKVVFLHLKFFFFVYDVSILQDLPTPWHLVELWFNVGH